MTRRHRGRRMSRIRDTDPLTVARQFDPYANRVAAAEEEAAARAQFRADRRAPRAIQHLENVAVSRGMDPSVARVMVADVLATMGDLPDVRASWESIFAEVLRRSDIPPFFRTDR